jgi:hypothetical protein
VVALLLISAQPGVETVTTVVDGEESLTAEEGAVIVAGGTVTVADGERVNASLYVIDGAVRIDGTVDGDVFQLAGEVSASATAAVTGTYRAVGGTRTVAGGAAVPVETVAEPLTGQRSPAEAAGVFFMQALALAAVSYLLGRRYPDLLGTVSETVRAHPAVSGTVGLLATVTLLAVFVFMAFTIVLLPVTVLGLVGGLLVALYAYVCVGYLLGQYLRPERPGVGTAAGAVAFLGLSELLGFVPVVGGLVPLLVLVTAIGAVLITYFGLRAFQPPRLRPVE